MEKQHIIPVSLDSIPDTETMSSRQIAKLAEKNHADVVRDIKVMCQQMEWGISKFADTYIHPQNGQKYTEYKPLIASPKNKTKRKTNTREGYTKELYDLGTHLSFRNLAERLDRQRCFVVETFEKMRIVKWLEGRRKWKLTEKGWSYGAMYDPTNKELHLQPGQRTVSCNARPVFKLSVIDLF